MSFTDRFRTALREFDADLTERAERRRLLLRPWEEDFLHWSSDGHLHGRLPPPPDGRRHSVTRGGWCPGARAA